MVATRILWRWRTGPNASYIETTEAGQRCDWVTTDHAYYQLGWAVKA